MATAGVGQVHSTGFNEEAQLREQYRSAIQQNRQFLLSNHDSAAKYATQAYGIAQALKDTSLVLQACIERAYCCQLLGDYAQGFEIVAEATQLAKQSLDTISLCHSYNIGGMLSKGSGNFTEALAAFNKCHLLGSQVGHPHLISMSLGNLSGLYWEVGDWERAEEFLLESLTMFEAQGHPHNLIKAYANLGRLYLETANYEAALPTLNKALMKSEEVDDPQYKGVILESIAETYLKWNDLQLALNFALKGLHHCQKHQTKRGFNTAYLLLGEIYFAQEQLDSAAYYLENRWQTRQELSLEQQIECSHLLYRLHKRLGETAVALQFSEISRNLSDSLHTLQTDQNLIEEKLKLDFEKAKTADSLRLAQSLRASTGAEKPTSRMWLYLLLALGTGAGAAFYFFRRQTSATASIVAEGAATPAGQPGTLPLSPPLNYDSISRHSRHKLNKSDWNILKTLCDNSQITNRQLADKVHLSYDGVRSCLKKLYKCFDIDTDLPNCRMSLINKVQELSLKK